MQRAHPPLTLHQPDRLPPLKSLASSVIAYPAYAYYSPTTHGLDQHQQRAGTFPLHEPPPYSIHDPHEHDRYAHTTMNHAGYDFDGYTATLLPTAASSTLDTTGHAFGHSAVAISDMRQRQSAGASQNNARPLPSNTTRTVTPLPHASQWLRFPSSSSSNSLSIAHQMDLLSVPQHHRPTQIQIAHPRAAMPAPEDATMSMLATHAAIAAATGSGQEPTDIIAKLVSNCNVLSQFAERYDIVPESPPSDEVGGMAEIAVAVIRLIEELHRASLGPDEPLPPFSEDLASPTPTHGRKRSWDEMTAVEREDQNDKDMAAIREKRQAQLAAQASSGNPRPPVPKSKPRKKTRAAPPEKCQACYNHETPEWRRGPFGSRTLCNACGIHYAKIMSRRIPGVEADPEKEMAELRATVQLPPSDGSAPRPRRMRRVGAAVMKKAVPELKVETAPASMESFGTTNLSPLAQPHTSPAVAGASSLSPVVAHGHDPHRAAITSPAGPSSAALISDRSYALDRSPVESMSLGRSQSQQLSFAEAGSSLLQTTQHALPAGMHVRRSLPTAFDPHQPPRQPYVSAHPTRMDSHPSHMESYAHSHPQGHIHTHSVSPLHSSMDEPGSAGVGGMSDGYLRSSPVNFTTNPFTGMMQASRGHEEHQHLGSSDSHQQLSPTHETMMYSDHRSHPHAHPHPHHTMTDGGGGQPHIYAGIYHDPSPPQQQQQLVEAHYLPHHQHAHHAYPTHGPSEPRTNR